MILKLSDTDSGIIVMNRFKNIDGKREIFTRELETIIKSQMENLEQKIK